MTLASPNSRVDYVGNGATDTYPYTFKIFSATDLLVTTRDTSDVETTLVYLADYSVTGAGSAGGGNVILTAGNLASGYAISIRRVRPVTQGTDIRNQGAFYPETHENAFDHQVMLVQQQQEELARTLKLPETEAGSAVGTTIPAAASRAGKLLGFDSSGNPTALTTIPTSTVAVSAFGETLLDDATAEAARATLGFTGAGSTVGTDNIDDDAVTADKISDDAVGTAQIQDDAVTTDKIPDGSVTFEKLDPAYSSSVGLNDGWITIPDTLTYVSATTFTVPGDQRDIYRFGARIKLTQSAAVKYFYVKNAAYASVTTVTVTGGDDYSLANAAISSPAISFHELPYGFPVSFDYTPTYAGWTSPTIDASFSMSTDGYVKYKFYVTGTSDDTKTALSFPIRKGGSDSFVFPVLGSDNGTTMATPAKGVLTAIDSGSLRFGKEYDSSTPSIGTGSWTASGTKSINGFVVYDGEMG